MQMSDSTPPTEVPSNHAALQAFLRSDARCLEFAVRRGFCCCESTVATQLSAGAQRLRGGVVLLANTISISGVKTLLYRCLGMRIGRNVYISPQVMIDPLFPQLIELEDDVLLGIGCRLLAHEYTATHFRVGRVRIGAGSVVGAFATVRSGVYVGRRATVGMHSFVNRDVADNTTVGGVPARPLRSAPE